MKWFRRGRHRANKHSIRVVDLNPSTVPGMTFATYAPIERWLRLPGAHLTMPIEDVFAARDEMWARRTFFDEPDVSLSDVFAAAAAISAKVATR